MRVRLTLIAIVLSGVLVLAAAPASRPVSDPTVDWLLTGATTAPTTTSADPGPPSTQPFAGPADRDGYRKATIVMHSGEKIVASIRTTRDKPVRLFAEDEKQFHDIPFSMVASIEATVIWERQQEEYQFVNAGSDIKTKTGKSYPARELRYTIKLTTGQEFTGGVVAPLYLANNDGDDRLLVLNKRQKGEIGQTLADLDFVKTVSFE